MKLIERYIFGKVVRAFLMSLLALGTTVWLTQALREFDLVAAMGQSILTFLQITLLLLPALTTIVAPVALMIGVIYTFNLLNDGSELVVINATGARQWSLLKPVLLIATGVAIFMASMTLYFSPLSMRLWRELVTDVRGSVVSSLLKEGEFIKLAPGLTFQLRQRMPDGTLHGIFMSDTRDSDETSTYLAERGAVLDNALGVFLVMADGTIQQRKKSDGSISFIQFSQYAYDLSSFSSTSAAPRLRPAERPTSYLLDPDPDDRFFQQHPEKYMSELHSRLTTPLNAFVFAILPLVFLSQAESTRQRRGATIGLAVGSAVALAVIEFVLNGAAETSLPALIGLYTVPIAAVSICVLLILTGIQPRPPEQLLILSDRIAAGARNLLRIGRTPAPATGEG